MLSRWFIITMQGNVPPGFFFTLKNGEDDEGKIDYD